MGDGRSSADAVPAEAAALGERFGLGRYESALTGEIYSPAREWGRRLRFAAIVLPFVVVAPVVGTRSVVFGVVAALSVVCLWVVGTVLWRRARVLGAERLLWFADGFVQLTADRQEPTVLCWRDATSFTVRVVESDVSHAYHISSCSVGESSGRRVTLVGWQGRALAGKADQMLAPRLGVDLLRALDAGEPVHFGRLGIDHAGITDTPDDGSPPVFVPWPALRLIVIAGRVKIALHDHGSTGSHTIDLDGVSNAFVVWRVIEYATASHPIQIRYADDGHLPPRIAT